MSIHRTNLDSIFRIDSITKDRDEDKEGRKDKKRVVYNGRSWKETEENLPVQPKESKKESKKYHSTASPLYVDHFLYEKAKARFAQLTTLEEKCAQLCFYQTQAIYDETEYNELKNLVLNEELGGILFTDGLLTRELFLIENLQKLSKTPLLFGNTFSFGYKTVLEPSKLIPEMQTFGSQWMVAIQKLGIHFQMDYSPILDTINLFNEEDRRQIRQGMKGVRGVIGKLTGSEEENSSHHITPHLISQGFAFNHTKNELINEVPGLKTLEFTQFQTPTLSSPFLLLKDAFLFTQKEDLEKMIKCLTDLTKSGEVLEEELDKKVLRILLFKSLLDMKGSSQKTEKIVR